MARVKAKIKHELLIWAREEAGLDRDVAAKKIGIDVERLIEWEEGKDAPTINQLRKTAEVYKRPLAVFYLPEVPTRFRVMQDFRRLPGEVAGVYSSELRLEFRTASLNRDTALGLYKELGEEPSRFNLKVNLNDDPENVGQRLREYLGVDIYIQQNWRDARIAFRAWRERIEAAGVLVFQITTVPVSEVRGFAMAEPILPVIAVNRKDAYAGRVFSMLHELCHVALGQGGICDYEEDGGRAVEDAQIEVFCNSVAGAALVSKRDITGHEMVLANKGKMAWSDEALEGLARDFCVSREVVLRRLLVFGLTSENFYREARRRLLAEYEALRKAQQEAQEKGEYKRNMPLETVGRLGPNFIKLVIETYHQKRISLSEVSSFLGVGIKHIPKIELLVGT